ncbi:hypothetical protein HMPREF0201_02685 [Cedecea davisae DSM 4568]|uniref:Uncharacterized protein n=1 Tax=Cedecea davisae DSM 4568 TaxID=566551 RepID=S3IRB8_9ENTR|nr:hypothetical protein HMPREF0201_02685 [Cedecea davisae DSM 4568]
MENVCDFRTNYINHKLMESAAGIKVQYRLALNRPVPLRCVSTKHD